jgi:hypothetical protein
MSMANVAQKSEGNSHERAQRGQRAATKEKSGNDESLLCLLRAVA